MSTPRGHALGRIVGAHRPQSNRCAAASRISASSRIFSASSNNNRATRQRAQSISSSLGSMGRQSHFFARSGDGNRPQRVMGGLVHKAKSIAGPDTASQLTLNFEPALCERFSTLREFLAHSVQVQSKPAKSIAMDMDMSPSTLSRKLSPGDGDTQRFNVDDLERYIGTTGDTACIEYLAAKYLESNEARRLRMLSRAEQMLPELARILSAMQETR